MSRTLRTSILPTLTPSCVTAGKDEAVVVEFCQHVPQDVLITFDFFYESSSRKLGTVPAVVLGPNVVRANFPGFPKPGEVEVTVKLAREESNLFPKFRVHVQSPVEAIYHSVPMLRPSHRVGLLASILAYLMHNDLEKEKDRVRSYIDVSLCNILQSAEIPEWNLSLLIAGHYGPNENLLHFCMRHKFDGMANVLLSSKHMDGKLHLLQSKGYDNRTPVEIAKKNGMKRVCDQIDKLQSSTAKPASTLSGHTGERPKETKQRKRRLRSAPPAPSFDLDSLKRDIGPLPLFIHKDVGKPKKPKQKLAGRIKAVFTGDKGRIAISSPHDPYQMRLSLPETCPLPDDSDSSKPSHVIGSEINNNPGHPSYSERGSMRRSGDSEESMAVTDKETDDATASPGGRSAVSNALYELKKKSLYTAVVVEDYQWSSSPFGDFTLRVGDQVYVTKEVEGGMCLGVSNNCYGKFPLDILKPVISEKPEDDAQDSSSDEVFNPYDKVYDMEPMGYLIPKSVPHNDSDSGSESDHTYELPPCESPPGEEPHYKKVPRRTETTLGVRLLSQYIDSSSHDTGLNRLGLTLESMQESSLRVSLFRPASFTNVQNADDTAVTESITVPSIVVAATSDPCLSSKQDAQEQVQSGASVKDTGSETVEKSKKDLDGTGNEGISNDHDETIQKFHHEHTVENDGTKSEVTLSPTQTLPAQKPEKENKSTQRTLTTEGVATPSSPRVKKRSLPSLPTAARSGHLLKAGPLAPKRTLPTPPANNVEAPNYPC